MISTHTPLAGRDAADIRSHAVEEISTHTPLAGRDDNSTERRNHVRHFYSHAPCGT